MAWRDDKLGNPDPRGSRNRAAGQEPRAFAELLFGYSNIEDLDNYDAASLAVLAEQAWEHVQRRTSGSADIRVINPTMPDGREISVLEVLNDNMPFLYRLHHGGARRAGHRSHAGRPPDHRRGAR